MPQVESRSIVESQSVKVKQAVQIDLALAKASLDLENLPDPTAEDLEVLRIYKRPEVVNPGNIIDDFLARIERNPPLPPLEQLKLIKKAQAGDNEARNKLIETSLQLVVYFAKRYIGKGVPFEDLIQEGTFGLKRAINSYDFSFRTKEGKHIKFSTHASSHIRQALGRTIDRNQCITTPSYAMLDTKHLKDFIEQLARQLKHEPDFETIAQLYFFNKYPQYQGFDPSASNDEEALEKYQKLRDYIEALLRANQTPSSLDIPIETTRNDRDSEPMVRLIRDDEVGVEEQAELNEVKAGIDNVLSTLSEKERYVIIHRFGLRNYQPRTLEAIGKDFGLTRERTRQIEARALRKLKHPTRTKKLKDYKDF